MGELGRLFKVRTYLVTYLVAALAVAAFSQFVVHLFGQTIPGIIWTFFKDAGDAVMLATVFVFAFTWLLRARPHNRPKQYTVVVFDVCGREVAHDGLRTKFKTHDVAWSFMKQYKKVYPLYNFTLVSDVPPPGKPTILRYI